MVGAFSVAMLGLAITGLVLWWPRKILSVGSASSWKRTNFDLHNVLGFYSSLVMLFITLSGVLIAFEGATDPLVRRLNDTPDAPAPQSTPVAGGQRIAVDEAIAIAEERSNRESRSFSVALFLRVIPFPPSPPFPRRLGNR